MIQLKVYHPLGVGQPEPNAVTLETNHFVSAARARVLRVGHRPEQLSAQEIQWLESDFRNVMSGGFRAPTVVASRWKGSTRHSALYGLWESQAEAVKQWRELLRDYWEQQHYCGYCGLYRNPVEDPDEGVRLPLDHYLPRSAWPELAVCPANLVPACDTCNSRLKLEQAPADGCVRLFLHPYYDDFVQKLELVATVAILGDTPSVGFKWGGLDRIGTPEGLVATSHLSLLNLSARYATKAARDALPELRELVISFIGSGDWTGRADVQRHLERLAVASERTRGARNWSTALYRGLSASSDYTSWVVDRAVRDIAQRHAATVGQLA